MEKKLKVVLVCAFSNAMVRSHLPLDDRKLYNFIRKCLGMEPSRGGYGDVGSWTTNFINNFKTREDVELTIISSHSGLKKGVVHFEAESVQYYFVRSDRTTLLKRLIKSPSLWHKLNPMRPAVRKIVRKVNPDVVALMGAENAFISGTILGLEKEYPVIFKAQTIYNNPDRGKHGVVDAKNAYVEKLIFDALDYASVTTKMHYKLYRDFRKDSFNFRWKFGTTYHDVIPVEKKEFDFVNFANNMIPAKGFADVLEAMGIVVKTHPEAVLNLIGSPSAENKKLYDEIIAKHHLENNVVFTPFFAQQADMFQHLQKSHFAVLPYKLDYIASTTYQAMYYEMPVVVYRTEGTPTLNKDNECVLIADMENVQQLAEKMLILLQQPEKADELRRNAKTLVDYQNDGKRISDEIMAAFCAIDAHFHNGTPIPKELIYNPLEQ